MLLDLADITHSAVTEPVNAHPLLATTKSLKSANVVVEVDPLAALTLTDPLSHPDADFSDPLGAIDPLTAIAVASVATKPAEAKPKKTAPAANGNQTLRLFDVDTGKLANTLEQTDDDQPPDLDLAISGFAPWSAMRTRILENFTATDQLSLESSFLRADSVKSEQRAPPKHHKKHHSKKEESNKVKLVGLSQIEFESKIKDFRKLLRFFWDEERRLECIQLSIEVAKLLHSVTVPQYYPSLFVHVTDFLDTFGDLVYQRLLAKAKEERTAAGLPSLPTHFVTADILERTRITARNWFGKVQEVDEVLPRIYLELALLKCMRFMDDSAIVANLMRMGSMARNLQHPLISSYARCYLCRITMRLNPMERGPHWLSLNDWMQTYTTQPVCLLWPALEYVVQCVSYGAITYNDLLPIWEYCSVNNRRNVILCSFINGVSKFYLSEHALEATKLVTDAEDVTAEEISILGRNLNCVDIDEKHKKTILKSVWRCINRIVPVPGFLSAISIWIEFVAKHFTTREIDIIFDQIVRIIAPNKIFENHYTVMSSILSSVFTHSKAPVTEILQLDSLIRFVDLFRKDTARREATSTVLQAFVDGCRQEPITDLRLAFLVVDMCKRLHDSFDLYTSPEDIDEAAKLIESALNKFGFSNDPERNLEFLVSCRAATMNMDGVQKYIIHRIQVLILDIIRRSRFSTAQAVFIQSCVANLYIMIPSIESVTDRIQLYVQSGQVALAAQAFVFVPDFVSAAARDFGQVKNGTDFARLTPFFLALLVTTPDSVTENGTNAVLDCYREFLNAVIDYPWTYSPAIELQHGRILIAGLQSMLIRRRLYDKTIIGAATTAHLFKWIDRSEKAKQRQVEAIDVNITLTVDNLQGILRSEKGQCTLNMEFVEVVAKFSTSEVVESLAAAAKEAYKKCKKVPEFAGRLKAVKGA
uniref:UPF0505 protein CG8202 n=1 Tax=Panagrellus redivivus TaxID=6233 RepID=A0A7E4VNU3_PANRE